MKPRIQRVTSLTYFVLTELRGEEAAEAVGHEDDRPVPVRHARVLHQEPQAPAEVGERPWTPRRARPARSGSRTWRRTGSLPLCIRRLRVPPRAFTVFCKFFTPMLQTFLTNKDVRDQTLFLLAQCNYSRLMYLW